MMINRENVPITSDVFLAMSEADKERVMCILTDIGLNEFNPSMSSPVIGKKDRVLSLVLSRASAISIFFTSVYGIFL